MQLYLFILLDQTKQNKKKEEFENLKYEQEFISERIVLLFFPQKNKKRNGSQRIFVTRR